MVRHILGMLDDFLHAFPLLSFVRGEAFTPDHWASLFRTLEFDTSKVRSGNLCLVFGRQGRSIFTRKPNICQDRLGTNT